MPTKSFELRLHHFIVALVRCDPHLFACPMIVLEGHAQRDRIEVATIDLSD
jgi:hypothetical protein